MLFNRIKKLMGGVVNVNVDTLNITPFKHGGKTIVLNKVDGSALTLAPAKGTGIEYIFVVGATITSGSTTIKAPNGATTFTGNALVLQDAGDTVAGFETAGTTDTVTLNGGTLGGVKGARIRFRDIAPNLYFVEMISAGTGTEATPFSATVS